MKMWFNEIPQYPEFDCDKMEYVLHTFDGDGWTTPGPLSLAIKQDIEDAGYTPAEYDFYELHDYQNVITGPLLVVPFGNYDLDAVIAEFDFDLCKWEKRS